MFHQDLKIVMPHPPAHSGNGMLKSCYKVKKVCFIYKIHTNSEAKTTYSSLIRKLLIIIR